MVESKTNIQKYLTNVASVAGMAAMLLATGCSLVEHADHDSRRMAMAFQPQFTAQAQAVEQANADGLRKGGREEVHHLSVTYGAIKHSHGITSPF